MGYSIILTREEIHKFCAEYDCTPADVQSVMMAFFKKDLDSPHYRKLGGEKFDIDNFLISKSPSELLTLRSNALNRKTKLYEEIKEKKPLQSKLQ